METIESLCVLLSVSESQLKGLRRKYRMDHGAQAENELRKWLEHTWEEKRDKVRRLAKGSNYTEFWSGSMGASQRHQLGNLHQEPEAIPPELQEEYSRSGWETFGVLRGEELAKRETRSRAERLRQAEFELRKKGKAHEHYVQAVEEAIAAMRADAKAA